MESCILLNKGKGIIKRRMYPRGSRNRFFGACWLLIRNGVNPIQLITSNMVAVIDQIG